MGKMTMVERVAASISSADAAGHKTSVAYARAAIAAMCDPTPEMEEAFYAACDERGNVLWRYGYKAMIHAALAEHP